MPGPSRWSPFYRRLLLAGGSARRDGFYDYRDTRYSAGTAMRRRFERTRPPHTAWPVALANSHSCQLPFFAALCHGQLIANRATVSARTETHGTAPERPCDGASSAPAHHTRLGLWLLPTLTPANELPFFAALCHGVCETISSWALHLLFAKIEVQSPSWKWIRELAVHFCFRAQKDFFHVLRLLRRAGNGFGFTSRSEAEPFPRSVERP
mmetsp:Transcript_6212/g.15544  ORF Transcript_6212/g.15544 Transcript_6212/m.15544 type:complete len:210 (-) Transcript_6212:513-1142(-)